MTEDPLPFLHAIATAAIHPTEALEECYAFLCRLGHALTYHTLIPMSNQEFTLLVTDQPKNSFPLGTIESPDCHRLHGMSIIAMSAGDVFQQRDNALALIARIVAGNIDDSAIQSACHDFLATLGYRHTYPTLIKLYHEATIFPLPARLFPSLKA